jgi:uncharacterized membrane protein
MNKIIINSNNPEKITVNVGDVVITEIGSAYLRTFLGYVNLADANYILEEQFTGKVSCVIRNAVIEVSDDDI